MGHALDIITGIRDQIAESLERLADVRARRDLVVEAASSFPGALRTYRSGSLATGLVNEPVSDGDGGVVLDRRTYRDLGPDGTKDRALEIVEQMHKHIAPRVRKVYPNAIVKNMKRGVTVHFGAPYPDGEDPTVDLVIALNRVEDDALWIPNLDRDRWDPSHPEKHVELLNGGTRKLRRARAQAIRICKAWNSGFTNPALSSFNVAVLGWESITTPLPLDEAVATLLEHGATSLAERLTPDPAGVSAPLKLELDRDITIKRLSNAAEKVRNAIEAIDRDEAQALLAEVFPQYVTAPGGLGSLINDLRRGVTPAALREGAGSLKRTRAYGGRRG